MTDHSPDRAAAHDGDDGHRSASGAPLDTTAEFAVTTEAGVTTGADGTDAADGPPPQLSGLPGWGYVPAQKSGRSPWPPHPNSPRFPPLPPLPTDGPSRGPFDRRGASDSARVSSPRVSSATPDDVQSAPVESTDVAADAPAAVPSGTAPDPGPKARPKAASKPGARWRPALRPSRSTLVGLLAGGAAVAAVAVAGSVLSSGGDAGGSAAGSGTGDSPDLRMLSTGWTVPGTATDHQVGTWVTDTYLVRATQSGVRAYRLSDGKPAWTAQPLSGPHVPCAMSPTVSASGIGTIGFGPDAADCTTVVGVDTRTGRTLWSTPLTAKDHPDAAPTTTFLDGQVGVLVNGTVVGGVDLTDGHVVWGYKPRGQYCNAYPYGGAGAVLVDDYCADASPAYMVTAFDAATGKQLWHKPGTDHVQFGSVVDAAPVVASLAGGAVDVYGVSGAPRPLALGNGLEPDLGAAGGADSGARLVGASTLLLPTRSQPSSRAVVTAVNTGTGAVEWTYDGEAHQGAVLVRAPQGAAASGGKVYAISLVADFSEYGSPELVSLDPVTGHATPLVELPPKPSSFLYAAGTVWVLPDGRVLLVAVDGTGTAVRIFE